MDGRLLLGIGRMSNMLFTVQVKEGLHFVKTLVKGLLFFYLPIVIALTILHFPYDTDPPPRPHARPSGENSAHEPTRAAERSTNFYEAAYDQAKRLRRGMNYEATAKRAADTFNIEKLVREFVSQYNLEQKKVLEVGSGRGYLQDLVQDYTGLDLSPSAAKFYHKPFVIGSATRMPFADSSFDAIWTIWVLEHIREPERALLEMRRVLRPQGLIFLYVAWNCKPWAADGFEVRPYSDFNWRGRLVKASIPIRASPLFQITYGVPTRLIRWLQYSVGVSTSLHYRRLDPNYEVYWQPDSDAAVSLESFEVYLWFLNKGDECLNCTTAFRELLTTRNPLIIRVRKKETSPQ